MYKGFKKWIESPFGYLSFQKKNIGPRTLTLDPIDMTELNKIQEELKALDSEEHTLNVEIKALGDEYEEIQKKVQTEKDHDAKMTMYTELSRLHGVEMSKMTELAKKKTSKLDESTQEMSVILAVHEKYSQENILKFYTDLAQDLKNAPKLQPSKMARVTGLWRKAVDVMLYAPRVTDAVAVLGVSYALYLGSIWLRNKV